MSQDGALCVWESDTELDGLTLAKRRNKPEPGQQEEEEERLEGEEGEVIRGKAEISKGKDTKNVRYRQLSK